MLSRALAAVAWAVTAATIPAAAATSPCPGGRFVVPGSPLLNVPIAEDVVFVGGAVISTASGCPPIVGKVKGSPRGTRVTAKWKNGCGAVPGRFSLKAKLPPTCDTMTAIFRAAPPTPRRMFVATREAAPPCSEDTSETFDLIQQRIFGYYGCNVASCHGPLQQAGLDLRAGAAYADLVGAAASNPGAAARGKLRVVPGDAAASFLSQKLHGTQAPDEGATMPLIGLRLGATELALLDAWIDAGAPETGHVAGAPCLPPLEYVPPPPPKKPRGGYQIVLDGPLLQPGQEVEGCHWVRAPYSRDFFAGKWEFVLNPGTHHFAVYNNRDDVPSPPLGVFLEGDFGCFQEASFGASLSGAPQSPYYVDAYPAGVARRLRADKYLGLNAHYRNSFDVPMQIRVWINVYPFEGTPTHVAETLTSLDTTFDIDVPPFTQKTQVGRFVNTLGVPMKFSSLSGHMHKRGLRFTVWRSDGTKVYENFDWAHPLQVEYTPPLVLAPGDWFDYECLHDNGVTRPVKTIGGAPAHLRFGVTTDDEMCILPGVYWID